MKFSMELTNNAIQGIEILSLSVDVENFLTRLGRENLLVLKSYMDRHKYIVIFNDNLCYLKTPQ